MSHSEYQLAQQKAAERDDPIDWSWKEKLPVALAVLLDLNQVVLDINLAPFLV